MINSKARFSLSSRKIFKTLACYVQNQAMRVHEPQHFSFSSNLLAHCLNLVHTHLLEYIAGAMDKGFVLRGQTTRPLNSSFNTTRPRNVCSRRTRGPISVVARTVRF